MGTAIALPKKKPVDFGGGPTGGGPGPTPAGPPAIDGPLQQRPLTGGPMPPVSVGGFVKKSPTPTPTPGPTPATLAKGPANNTSGGGPTAPGFSTPVTSPMSSSPAPSPMPPPAPSGASVRTTGPAPTTAAGSAPADMYPSTWGPGTSHPEVGFLTGYDPTYRAGGTIPGGSPGPTSAGGASGGSYTSSTGRNPDLQWLQDKYKSRFDVDNTKRTIDKSNLGIMDAAALGAADAKANLASRGASGSGAADAFLQKRIFQPAQREAAGKAADIALQREKDLDALTLGGQGIMSSQANLQLAEKAQALQEWIAKSGANLQQQQIALQQFATQNGLSLQQAQLMLQQQQQQFNQQQQQWQNQQQLLNMPNPYAPGGPAAPPYVAPRTVATAARVGIRV